MPLPVSEPASVLEHVETRALLDCERQPKGAPPTEEERKPPNAEAQCPFQEERHKTFPGNEAWGRMHEPPQWLGRSQQGGQKLESHYVV